MMLISTSLAEAQPSEEFPESISIEIEGERHQAFDFVGFRQLLRLDAERVHLIELGDLLELQIDQLEEQASHFTRVLTSYESSIDILQAERDRIFEKWKEENKRVHELENKPNIAAWITSALAAVAVVAAVSFGIALRLQ